MATVAAARVGYSSGAVEGLKYLALISMCVDHINKAFFSGGLDWAVPFGRLAMPIFTFVLAYNCARPGADITRTFRRLVFFGSLALPFESVVNGGEFLPLNVLFTFAVGVSVVLFIQRQAYWFGAFSLVLGGLFVDYGWTGPLLFVAAYWFCRDRSQLTFSVCALALFAMCEFVGNYWAFLAVFPLVLGLFVSPRLLRLRWLFWAFYPAHLALLWGLSQICL